MCEFCKCVLSHTFCFSFCFGLFWGGGGGWGGGKGLTVKEINFLVKKKLLLWANGRDQTLR